MKNNWKDIWANKSIRDDVTIKLGDLIKADGFDTGVGSYDEEKWQKMVADFFHRTSVKEGSNIIELGCGCGAFLFALKDIVKANYFGIDYSENLIKAAKRVMPDAKFVVDEIKNLSFPETKFDLVLSHAVFFYLPDHQYAEKVLRLWVNRISDQGKLVLMDMNDVSKEKIYHKERMLAYKTPQEYEATYRGLDHLFFDKKSIEYLLTSLGMKNIEYFPHAVSEYGNSKFRFNLICTKG